ncbi:hypothetical protein LSAT2_031979 [Lamellibrachia satsuma]|nr:hypothetical protein LSAT2_031979 [Lamellibrachia satsuma]
MVLCEGAPMADDHHVTHRMTSQHLGVNNAIPNLNLNVNYGGHLHEPDYACNDVSMGHVASGVWSSSDGDEGDYAGIQRERCRDLQISPELANVFCDASSVDLVNAHDAPSLLVTIGVGSNSAIKLLEHSDQGWCIQTVVHSAVERDVNKMCHVEIISRRQLVLVDLPPVTRHLACVYTGESRRDTATSTTHKLLLLHTSS